MRLDYNQLILHAAAKIGAAPRVVNPLPTRALLLRQRAHHTAAYIVLHLFVLAALGDLSRVHVHDRLLLLLRAHAVDDLGASTPVDSPCCRLRRRPYRRRSSVAVAEAPAGSDTTTAAASKVRLAAAAGSTTTKGGGTVGGAGRAPIGGGCCARGRFAIAISPSTNWAALSRGRFASADLILSSDV